MKLYTQTYIPNKSITWKEAWAIYKTCFLQANQVFLFCLLWFLLLLYGLFLLVQLPAGWLAVLFCLINGLFLTLPCLLYLHWLKIQTIYESNTLVGMKLAFISSFVSLTANLRLLIGLVLLTLLAKWAPALGFFVLVSFSFRFVSDSLEGPLARIQEGVGHD